jgi:integrase
MSHARAISADFLPRLLEVDGQAAVGPPPPTPWNPRWTLRRYYEECLLPTLLALGPRHPTTIELDRQGIEEFGWLAGEHLALGDFGAEHWLRFLTGLPHVMFRGRPRRRNTGRRVAVTVRHVLNRAAVQSWRDAQGEQHVGLCTVGRLQVPELERSEPLGWYSLDEVARMIAFAASPHADLRADLLMPGLAPQRFWPALITFAWNTGLRPKSILAARREWIGRETPGWLWLPREALKRAKLPCEFYLNRPSREAIDQAAGGGPRLFGWRWPEGRSQFFAEHKRIARGAGLSEERAGFQFKGYRRAMVNWVLATTQDTVVARLILGHRFPGSIDFYARRSSLIPPVLDAYPQPPRYLPMCG